jgi:glycosyltransferase involved in cell wall biosynthesis
MFKPRQIMKLTLISISSMILNLGHALEKKTPEKILICGVCQNVENSFIYTKRSIEELGSRFSDYAVIIYENNSTDDTARLYREWANTNPKVTFISENMHPLDLPWTRYERIARARNLVLAHARKPQYSDFPYFIMADLDFMYLWPIDEIVRSINLPIEWDCISANGVRRKSYLYQDRLAFRDERYPFGPDILASWGKEVLATWFRISGEELVPVFSAFGGLAIYKTATLLKFNYSGVATSELEEFYRQIIDRLPQDSHHLQQYLAQNHLSSKDEACEQSVFFRSEWGDNIQCCCEHVPLHAAMYIHGYNKFFINPKMYIYYEIED